MAFIYKTKMSLLLKYICGIYMSLCMTGYVYGTLFTRAAPSLLSKYQHSPCRLLYRQHDVTDPQTAPIGVLNLGTTCYLNSIIQVLYNTKNFRILVNSTRYEENSVGWELQSLFRDMMSNSTSKPIAPLRLLQKLKAPLETHEDAQEYLLKLLDQVSNP